MALKELEVRYASKRTKDYKLSDGERLYLLVRPRGSKLWRFKYRIAGKEKLLSFGAYLETGLAEARLKRAEARCARAGQRPRRQGQGSRRRHDFRGGCTGVARQPARPLEVAHATRLLTRPERDAFPVFGATLPSQVASGDVLAMVRRVEARGALDASRRLKQHVSQIYRFAIPQGWAETNPAMHPEGLLKPKLRACHMARVRASELPALVRAIDAYDRDEKPKRRAITRAALLFTLLTWARTNETRHATWGEFEGLDGAEPLWRLPAERMKMEREHLVPLGPVVVALLDTLRPLGSPYVFPGDKPAQPLSQNTMIFGCYRMGYRGRQTVHGFRGLASIWTDEAECYRPNWIELALSHAERDEVRGAYNNALYLTPRRRMLEPGQHTSWR